MANSENKAADAPKPLRNTGPGLQLQPGDVLASQFLIVRLIGFGGMGVVYEAINRLNDERVALKCIKSQHLARRPSNARFIEEINTARKLRHPNIVAVFDVAQDSQNLFFTMEYLDGESLRSRLNHSGRLPLGEVVKIMRPLCAALEYAHRYMIHRDLSPDNVFLLRDGTVKLLDFGLARDISRDTMTISGARIGKAQYMSPEQRKDAAHVDARADIYALGVMFFELLSGQLPLGYSRLSDHVPELPPACDELVGLALAPLERRIQSAAEFRAMLDSCLQSESRPAAMLESVDLGVGARQLAEEIAPRKSPPKQQQTEPKSRKPLLAPAAIGLFIALICVAAWILPRQPHPLPANPSEQEPQPQSKQQPKPAATPSAKPREAEFEVSPNPMFEGSMAQPNSQESAIARGKVYKKLTYPPVPSDFKVTWETSGNEAILRLPGGNALPMLWIAPGTFEMGSPQKLGDDFLPVHSVTLTKGFWLAKYEVTQAQWKAVMTVNPSPQMADQMPVEGVSWDDAMLFIRRLNRAGGKRLRMPTEAEWVYACEAGITEPGKLIPAGTSISDYAWSALDSLGSPHPVGTKQPNAWGLFDMTGNVWEWCSDFYGPGYRPGALEIDPKGSPQGSERMTMGGGSYISTTCELVRRNWFPPDIRAPTFGLRLCADGNE